MSHQALGMIYSDVMNLKLRAARTLGAIIVLIAFSLAPSVAQAHANHHHGPEAAHPATATHHAAVVSVDAAQNSGAEVRSAPASQSETADDGICRGPGCYCGAACAACFTAALPDLPFTVPPTVASSLVPSESHAGASIVLGGPRRPPRSFA